MRALAACLAIALAAIGHAPARAQAVEPGLYEGTIGTLPIRACFDQSANVAGAYYYLKHLKPIGLRAESEDATHALIESIGYDAPTGGRWAALKQSAAGIIGQWRNGKRRLPITLKPVPFSAGEYSGPCESEEFQAPRLTGSSIEETAAQVAGEAVTTLTYKPGPAFDPGMVEIATFALSGNAQPGDGAINAALREVLPASPDKSGVIECMGMMHLAWGADGNYSHLAQPEVVTPRWVGVLNTYSVYCGGAHPSFWESRQIFDRLTGAEVDPVSWFQPEALQFYEFEGEVSARPKRPVAGLAEGLHALVRKVWPSEDSECAGVIEEGLPGWDIGLGQSGMLFRPELPHSMTACAETVQVPWAELEPFLSETGRAVRASFR